MSARDDYPNLAATAPEWYPNFFQWTAMCDEIDRLRDELAKMTGERDVAIAALRCNLAERDAELAAIHDALPDCGTCGGTMRVNRPGSGGMSGLTPCPDCVDGKLSLARALAQVKALWAEDFLTIPGPGGETMADAWGRAWRDAFECLRSVRAEQTITSVLGHRIAERAQDPPRVIPGLRDFMERNDATIGRPCDWDQESFCVESECSNPASHSLLTGMVDGRALYVLVCCAHAIRAEVQP